MSTHAAADANPASADVPAGPEGDAGWAAATRAALAQADARLAKRFDGGEIVDKLVALRARAVDELILDAWRRCLPVADGAATASISLFAVGGYGRGELFPHSDIDLLVLADSESQQAFEPALARFLALLWDAGLQASQAVRSPAQCTEAAADQTVLTALMEARALVADATAQRQLQDAVSPERVWPARAFFEAKVREQAQRHARFGD
ncbi:MAG TPA: nucleotidyltransferase domain-containing protein, partial [Thermomonas sp.]|nr:nucleotidyltransferase domain-containing protein [Thermomonas sp.]